MMNLMKFAFGLALCGMMVACDDSSTSASDESGSSSKEALISSMNLESSSSVDSQSDESSSSSVAFGTMVDARDNQTYKTVTIGSQTWMAENLNYNYNEGTAVSYCYNGAIDSCAKYGRLYLWSAAMDSATVFGSAGKGCGYGVTCGASGTVRGVCPEGWHLPSSAEWSILFTTVGGWSSAGTVLKSTSGWYDDGNGEGSFGFSVLPAGSGNYDGVFSDAGFSAYFWSATEYDSHYAYDWDFCFSVPFAIEDYLRKGYGLSVRCVRD